MKTRLVDKLAEECTKNIEETRLVEITSSKNKSINTVLARCTLFHFQNFLQLSFELVVIFFIFIGT